MLKMIAHPNAMQCGQNSIQTKLHFPIVWFGNIINGVFCCCVCVVSVAHPNYLVQAIFVYHIKWKLHYICYPHEFHDYHGHCRVACFSAHPTPTDKMELGIFCQQFAIKLQCLFARLARSDFASSLFPVWIYGISTLCSDCMCVCLLCRQQKMLYKA